MGLPVVLRVWVCMGRVSRRSLYVFQLTGWKCCCGLSSNPIQPKVQTIGHEMQWQKKKKKRTSTGSWSNNFSIIHTLFLCHIITVLTPYEITYHKWKWNTSQDIPTHQYVLYYIYYQLRMGFHPVAVAQYKTQGTPTNHKRTQHTN
jgi:hypothetical protein